MLGFSVTKLLFTAAAILAVWYGFRWMSRVQARDRVSAERRMRADAGKDGVGAPASRPKGIEDMTACPTCGDYVAADSARNCGREGCPYPG